MKGVTRKCQEMRLLVEMSKNKVRDKFHQHRRNAACRGIDFELTFEEWFRFWDDSGHFHERGVKKGQYVMARYGDSGPYAIGNVKIIRHEENILERGVSAENRARLVGNTRALGNRFKQSAEAIKNMSKALMGRKGLAGQNNPMSRTNRARRAASSASTSG
jgi:hypothetical protein